MTYGQFENGYFRCWIGEIRMLINMAMGMRERDFRYMCWRMVNGIIEAAESMEGDIINAEYESLKKRNR